MSPLTGRGKQSRDGRWCVLWLSPEQKEGEEKGSHGDTSGTKRSVWGKTMPVESVDKYRLSHGARGQMIAGIGPSAPCDNALVSRLTSEETIPNKPRNSQVETVSVDIVDIADIEGALGCRRAPVISAWISMVALGHLRYLSYLTREDIRSLLVLVGHGTSAKRGHTKATRNH